MENNRNCGGVSGMSAKEIKEQLANVGYIPSSDIAYAVAGTINRKRPLLIEGDPGVGKTSLAKAVAKMLNVPMYRVQFYDGLTADKLLYDINYQKQLLTVQALQGTIHDGIAGMTDINDAIRYVGKLNFYGDDFLIKRPVLQALTSPVPCVLLLDEIDKSSEEIEYTLLEVLDEFAVTIPEYGRIEAAQKPMIFMTSNNYRELSEALKRRCNYLYIKAKTEDEVVRILNASVEISPNIALGVAKSLAALRRLNLHHQPSIAEAIDWAAAIKENPNNIHHTLSALIKNKKDMDVVTDDTKWLPLEFGRDDEDEDRDNL